MAYFNRNHHSTLLVRVYKPICLVIVMLTILFSACGQNIKYIDSYVIEKGGKYGLIDSIGNVIVPPSYLHARIISPSGLAIVVLDTIICPNKGGENTLPFMPLQDTLKIKYSYVNHKGKYQFRKPFFGAVLLREDNKANDLLATFCMNHQFSCGMAIITDTASLLNGFINVLGDTVIPMKYTAASPFQEDVAPVKTKIEIGLDGMSIVENSGNYGFINKQGKCVSGFKFSTLSPCYMNRAVATIFYERVIEESKAGETEYGISSYIVDRKGQIIEQLNEAYYCTYFTEDRLAVLEPTALGNYLGFSCEFLDYNGSIYKTDGKLSEDAKLRIMNKSTKCKGHMPDGFTKLALRHFANGYAGVMIGPSMWVFVDKNMMVWQPEDEPYQDITPFRFGIAAVKYKGKWGYVNTNFDYVVPLKYDSCCFAGKNLCKVYNSISDPCITSYIDRKGNVVWQNVAYTRPSPFRKMNNAGPVGKWRNIEYKY